MIRINLAGLIASILKQMICLYVISLVYYYKGLYLLYIYLWGYNIIFTIIIYVHFRPESIITAIEEMNIYLSKLFLNLFFSSLCVWSWHPATNNWNPFYYLFKVSTPSFLYYFYFSIVMTQSKTFQILVIILVR